MDDDDDDEGMTTRLLDGIEEKLINGQWLRATHDLMERRGIDLTTARTAIGRWLWERGQNRGRPANEP